MPGRMGPAGRGGARRRTRRRVSRRDSAMNSQNTQQNNAQNTQEDSSLEELEKLGELHEKGILTDEEFAAKKKEILG